MNPNRIDELRLDIWRELYNGAELADVQVTIEKKYQGEFSSITIAANISVICKQDYVSSDIRFREMGICSDLTFPSY